MTPSITACPPTIKSLSFVLNVFPVGQAFLPVTCCPPFLNSGQTRMSNLLTGDFPFLICHFSFVIESTTNESNGK